ncbi:hypothetical protein KFK09_020620 [Dendrobium nobile]|uniref:Uncharacterized protein n=1 Tax=Dendrobium nobile TaxID=94219 RepID=A0A8T3ALG0_DENNO|nr:hypothetical protein KFK09_020620 [Dendrobium nobile]
MPISSAKSRRSPASCYSTIPCKRRRTILSRVPDLSTICPLRLSLKADWIEAYRDATFDSTQAKALLCSLKSLSRRCFRSHDLISSSFHQT